MTARGEPVPTPAVAHPGRRARRPRPPVVGALLWPAAGIIAFCTVWEVLAARVADPAVLPAPGLVVRNLAENFMGSQALEFLGLRETSYLGNLGYTATIVVTAWLVGALVGVLVGVVSSRVQVLRDLVDPVLYLFGVVPVLVAAPFFLIWFGFGPAGQWALVAFFTFVVMAGAALASSMSAPVRFEEYAATLGLGTASRLRRIVFPQTTPANVAALRTSLAAAWGLQAIAELMGSQTGVGRVIAVRAGNGDVASVLALVLVLGFVAVAVDTVLAHSFRKAFSWQ